MDDGNALVVLQKFIKELEDEYEAFNSAERAEELKAQLDVVKVYLPQMMSEEEIRQCRA